MRPFGLGGKLTAIFGILGLLPLVLMGFVSIYVVKITHKQDVAITERELLRQKIEETKKFIDETVDRFKIRVTYSENLPMIISDQQFLMEKILQEAEFIQEVSFADLNGLETLKMSRVRNDFGPLNNISDLPKFLMAKSGRSYLGPAYKTVNGPMMTFSGPVLNRQGDVIMVFSGEISLSPLERILINAVLGETGYLYIIDNDGMIIGSSNNSLVGRDIASMPWIKNAAQRSVLETREGLLSKEVLAMTTPLKNLEWRAIAEWPAKDAFNVISTIRFQIILFSIAVTMLVAIMGWLVSRKILKPLATLNLAAKKIGSGNFGDKIKIKTGDEIEELGNVLNKMKDDLVHYIEELEKSHKQIEGHLQEINKLKDDFVFMAAHELRAPVTVLKAYVAEIIDDKKLMKKMEKSDPYFIEMIHSIDAAKDRLSNLLEDLLDVARMEAGKFKINIQEVDFAEVVRPFIQNFAELGKTRGITVSLKLNGEIPRLKIDPDRVNEILTNLVTNAIKYNRDGGKVTITASYANKKLCVEVSDTGVGLSEEEKQHLFEKFWRSEDVRKIEGTGLGLFIVKHILDQLNGTISFDSKKGEGTTFKFSLPVS